MQTRRTLYFFISLIGLIVLLELIARNTAYISSLTNRVRLQSTMYTEREPTEVLFIGTSRFKDGLSAKQIQYELNNKYELDWKFFNGGTAGSCVDAILFQTKEALQKEHLKLLVIEVSDPSFIEKPYFFHDTIHDKTVENTLFNFLYKHLSIVRNRKAFRLQSLKNIFPILLTDHFYGSEWFQPDGLNQILKQDSFPITSSSDEYWQSSLYLPDSNGKVIWPGYYSEIYDSVNANIQRRKIQVIYVIPPLAKSRVKQEIYMDNKYSTIATVVDQPLHNFCNTIKADKYFGDHDSHLNKEGKYYFSHELSKIIAKSLKQHHVIQ